MWHYKITFSKIDAFKVRMKHQILYCNMQAFHYNDKKEKEKQVSLP